jgi:hypothetical protein
MSASRAPKWLIRFHTVEVGRSRLPSPTKRSGVVDSSMTRPRAWLLLRDRQPRDTPAVGWGASHTDRRPSLLRGRTGIPGTAKPSSPRRVTPSAPVDAAATPTGPWPRSSGAAFARTQPRAAQYLRLRDRWRIGASADAPMACCCELS